MSLALPLNLDLEDSFSVTEKAVLLNRTGANVEALFLPSFSAITPLAPFLI